jgi:hypothetical protein
VLLSFTLAAPGRAAGVEPTPVAVFDMSFVNFGQEAEYARIAMLSAYLRELPEHSGRYRLVDTAPLADHLMGAGRSVTGSVRKLSARIQTVTLRERGTGTAEIVAHYQTDRPARPERSG